MNSIPIPIRIPVSDDGPNVDSTLGPAPRADAETFLPWRDRERLGALFARLEPRLESVAMRVTRDPEAARDVVQNAFERVLRHGAKFRGQSRVSTWMHRIVTNEALMWLRSRRRRREDPYIGESEGIPFAVDGADLPGDALDRDQQLQRLRRGVRELPAAESDVVRHCALDGQSYTEYARQRGLHPAAVKSRAFRARRRLAAMLGD
jgi:RNA polymerase sigma-70 factor (ECF subfamily)